MNFETIYNGMVGRDFIKVFNDNFTITDETFLSILATLLYKVKSTDIKEFKVIDGVVNYTLEDEPEEGQEDLREWIPVDITAWGNITGDINDQTDLKNALDSKAAADTVATLSNLVASINTNLTNVTNRVQDMSSRVTTNTSDIADLQNEVENFVYSTTIKAIRLNNSVFQWSPDGITWYEQPVINSVAWGRLTGNIDNQLDLKQKFDTLNNSITTINNNITSLSNTVTSLGNSLTNLTTAFTTFSDETTESISSLTSGLESTEGTAEEAIESAQAAASDIADHIADLNNPHQVTKNTIGLGNVDNTSDLNKPLSTPQKNYVDTAIAAAITGGEISGLVQSAGYATTLFVGFEDEYELMDMDKGIVGIIIDEDELYTSVTIYSDDYTDLYLWNSTGRLTPDDTQKTTVPYSATYNRVEYDLDYYYGAVVGGVDEKVSTMIDYTAHNTFTYNAGE